MLKITENEAKIDRKKNGLAADGSGRRKSYKKLTKREGQKEKE